MNYEINTWIEDLIWCPSQIYYYFIGKDNKKYCIYLRWRHSDPWTADLLRCKDNWDIDASATSEWINIELSRDYKDQEYKELEHDVYYIVNKAVGIKDFSKRKKILDVFKKVLKYLFKKK